MPPQAYGVVTDLSHLQQKLVELTTVSGSGVTPLHAPAPVVAQAVASVVAPSESVIPPTVAAVVPLLPVGTGHGVSTFGS